MNTVVCMPYSPFSQRARWALDAHGIDYRVKEHTPMLGTLGLRWRTGRWRGKVSVPVLVHDEGVVTDSYDIAEWSAERAASSPLITDDNRGAVRKWTALSDGMIEAGRVRVTQRVLGDRDALRESVPATMRWMGPLALPATRMGARYLLRKYPFDGQPERTLRDGCEQLRKGLERGRYLVGGAFSFADITMAVALEFVSPIEGAHEVVGPGSRSCWEVAELVAEFPELLTWRDELVAEHRVSQAAVEPPG